MILFRSNRVYSDSSSEDEEPAAAPAYPNPPKKKFGERIAAARTLIPPSPKQISVPADIPAATELPQQQDGRPAVASPRQQGPQCDLPGVPQESPRIRIPSQNTPREQHETPRARIPSQTEISKKCHFISSTFFEEKNLTYCDHWVVVGVGVGGMQKF